MFDWSHADGNVLAANQVTKPTAKDVDQVIRSSSPNFIGAGHGLLHIISENRLRKNIHKWLSPSDPSTNHNIACDTHNKKTATWFFQGNIFREWKSTGSLLWIHGKRAFLSLLTGYPLTRSRIIAGSGKSILWLVDVYLYPSCVTNVFCQFHDHPRY